MTPEQLKASILQMAIQGKLVEQRPEEGTAEELYQKIQKEKQKLIKEGKIKKEKPLEDIKEDEIPFDIPESWKWVKVTDCVSNKTGLSYNKGNLEIVSKKMIRVMRGGNILDMKYIIRDDDVFISEEFVKHELLLKKNTLITPAVTSLEHIGKMARIEKNYDDTVVGGFVLMLFPHMNNDTFSKYLLLAFSSSYFREYCRTIANKSGQAFYNLSRDKLMQLYIPLPPLCEQERIVRKVYELIPYVDKYSVSWNKLNRLNSAFPEDMKRSILQYAIQGKLVEQRSEEGTGEELYQKIQKEKQKLIKEGKIKKEKPLEEIKEDEIPFDIPESWKWVRLNELCAVLTCGYASTPTYVSANKGMPFISAKNVKPYRFMPDDHKYISRELYNQLTATTRPGRGDILLTRVGAGIGEAAIIDVDMDFAIYVSLTLIKLVSQKLINNRYILHWLNSPLGSITAQKNILGKGASQGNLNVKNVREFIIPLPPYKEQVRIANMLDELLPYCDAIA